MDVTRQTVLIGIPRRKIYRPEFFSGLLFTATQVVFITLSPTSFAYHIRALICFVKKLDLVVYHNQGITALSSGFKAKLSFSFVPLITITLT